MPRSFSSYELESLESLCVQSVAKNLGKVKWDQSFTEDEDADCSLSPLNVLPLSLLTSVIDAVKETRIINGQDNKLRLLIIKKLEELDLKSFCGLSVEETFHLVHYAALLHSPLKVLRFSLKEATYHQQLGNILPSFPNLQVLEVTETSSVDDSFLALVASSFPQLKSLSVANCRPVTDVGIQRLCTPCETSSDKGGGIRESLLKLNIRGTKVTREGARLALERLTKLQNLECRGPVPTVQVIVDMYRSGDRRPLSLKTLEIPYKYRGPDYEENSLADAIQLCPLLVDVDIHVTYEPSSQDLQAFLQLDNLRRLVLGDARRISFDEDLLPVLKKFGPKSLEFLYVNNIKVVNLRAIVEHCSKLRFLFLYDVGWFTQSPWQLEPSPRHLPSLQRLEIDPTDCQSWPRLSFNRQPSAADLLLLLTSAPSLVELKLEMLDNLSDRIFEKAIAQHGFPKLEKFQVVACPNVTKGVVDLLMELDNPLNSILIERYRDQMDCLRLLEVPNTNPVWTEEIKQKNLDLLIQYCEC